MSAKPILPFAGLAVRARTGAGAMALAGGALLLLSACGGEAETTADDALAITGSSTVYPFAQKVAEDFLAANSGIDAPRIESTGTSEGIAAFCAGDTPQAPDIVNASRRMTAEEFARCASNGVAEIIEVEIGRDGIAFVSSADEGIELNLSPAIIYRALAVSPFGQPQDAQNWSDVDGSLPAEPIIVYGPPPSSGTRDALLDLVLEPACAANGEMAALKESDPAAFSRDCHALRSDTAYIAQGEQDDLIVRKVAGNPRAVGIFGYSYLQANTNLVKALPISGVVPSAETIADGSYPASRPLYIYVRKARIGVKPGLEQYLAQWSKSWAANGPLAAIGLVPASAEAQTKSAAAITGKTALTAADLQ
jgi:phosphate transport system substrate-binding protein